MHSYREFSEMSILMTKQNQKWKALIKPKKENSLSKRFYSISANIEKSLLKVNGNNAS